MRLSGGLQYPTQGFRQANNFASSLISRSVQLAGTDTIAASGDLADASTRQIGQMRPRSSDAPPRTVTRDPPGRRRSARISTR